jgi:hypothetical protein
VPYDIRYGLQCHTVIQNSESAGRIINQRCPPNASCFPGRHQREEVLVQVLVQAPRFVPIASRQIAVPGVFARGWLRVAACVDQIHQPLMLFPDSFKNLNLFQGGSSVNNLDSPLKRNCGPETIHSSQSLPGTIVFVLAGLNEAR